jgi:carbamoyl-phosphate synthase large subunit
VVVQFGGQTPLKLALALEAAGVPIIGTSPHAIDVAEDRKKFGAIAERCGLTPPPNGTALTIDEARAVAAQIGFPLLVRPSYVLGGRAMRIVYDELALEEYMRSAADVSPGHPVLIDRFLEDAYEVDVDAVADRERCVIGGIMQHIEEAGIHSGDSACVLPTYLIRPEHLEIIREQTKRVALELGVVGLLNAQFAIKEGVVYILEVNPRASRTTPFVSKAIGVPLARIAARLMAGRTLAEIGFLEEPIPAHVSVKEVVLPFAKFTGVDGFLGPEMKSTGEVMGISDNFGRAFAKSQMAAGDELPMAGTVFISVNDRDQKNVIPIARDLAALKFHIIATRGTAAALEAEGLAVRMVPKLTEGRPNALDLIVNGEIDMIVTTPLGKSSRADDATIRRAAIVKKIPFITTLSAAAAAVLGIKALSDAGIQVRSLQEYHAVKAQPAARYAAKAGESPLVSRG